MNPATVTLLIIEALKAGTVIIEQVNRGEITPEEAAAEWQKQAASWAAAVDMWRATPSG